MLACIICGNPAEIHHVASRKARPDLLDHPNNHCPLCRQHHQEIHAIGRSTFAQKHPQMTKWLLSHGWEKIGHKWAYIAN